MTLILHNDEKQRLSSYRKKGSSNTPMRIKTMSLNKKIILWFFPCGTKKGQFFSVVIRIGTLLPSDRK